MPQSEIRRLFSSAATYIHVAEYISGDRWWLDRDGHNWWNRKTHFHYHAVYLPKIGEFDLRIEDTWYHVTPGHLVYIPADSDLEYFFDGKGTLEKYFIHFDLSFGAHRLSEYFQIPCLIPLKDEGRIEGMFTELRRLCADGGAPVAQLAANGLLLSLVAEMLGQSDAPFIRTPEKMEKEMRDTVEHINAHLGESLSVAALAARVGYSAPYFTKKFKKAFGTTPTEYIANLKIDYAKSKLMSGEMSVSAVASSLGFCDASYFSNFFKSKTGLYPGYYRKKG